jgi:tRNA G18 (ribose-2'-O)-methylase SpoU
MFTLSVSQQQANWELGMRGYFGVGVERLSKPMNGGSLFRSAHAFGASFIFTIDSNVRLADAARSDTSESWKQLPFYRFESAESMLLPKGCAMVGIEFLEDATELPSFRHPGQAAYVLGPERGSLSQELVARCEHVVRIPTRLCVNVGIAGAIVMYDRLLTVGRFAERPVTPSGTPVPVPDHFQGVPVVRNAVGD